MSKYELIEPQVIEGFRVLKMKEEIQAKIYRDIEGLDAEGTCEYFRRDGQRLQLETAAPTPVQVE